MKKLFIIILSTLSLMTFAQKKVAILECVDRECNVSQGVKLMVRSSLSMAIAETPGYEAFDRVDIASILGEQEFQRTGLIKETDIRKLGEMTGASYILVAEVAYLNESTVIILAKFLDVETAKIEGSSSVHSSTSIEDLDRKCKLLARKLLKLDLETGAIRSKITYEGGIYEGEVVNGKPHGQGKLLYSLNNVSNYVSYEGDWFDGEKQGKGTMIWKNGDKYVGNWKNNKQDGQGNYYWADGSIYNGNWEDSKKNGQGVFYYAPNNSSNIVSNEGYWLNDKEQGQRTIIWKDGTKYVGGWENDKRNGQGTEYFLNGDKLIGTWYSDKRNGKVIWHYINGDREECQYLDGKIADEDATYYWGTGEYMTGTYLNGKKSGKWIKRQPNGTIICTYTYKEGNLIKTKEEKTSDMPKGIFRKVLAIPFSKKK